MEMWTGLYTFSIEKFKCLRLVVWKLWYKMNKVQTVSVGCISRSRGQKIGFQNAIFKNLLVWNYKAQSFHIW